MFSYIKGVLVSVFTHHVILENGGIGYKILVPINTFNELPQLSAEVSLHISFVVRELSQTFYGFLSQHERDFFEVLMGVTGVGPKLALALIGHMPLSELQCAIVNEDSKTLCQIPGIGKKSAERLIVELRDKLHLMSAKPCFPSHANARTAVQVTILDATSALISLGYNQNISQKAIQRSLELLPEPIDLSSLIATALKHV